MPWILNTLFCGAVMIFLLKFSAQIIALAPPFILDRVLSNFGRPEFAQIKPGTALSAQCEVKQHVRGTRRLFRLRPPRLAQSESRGNRRGRGTQGRCGGPDAQPPRLRSAA